MKRKTMRAIMRKAGRAHVSPTEAERLSKLGPKQRRQAYLRRVAEDLRQPMAEFSEAWAGDHKGRQRARRVMLAGLPGSPRRPVPAKPRSQTGVDEPDLSAHTRDELRALCKERGLTGYGKLNKAGLIEALS